jgi:hypothetical protein
MAQAKRPAGPPGGRKPPEAPAAGRDGKRRKGGCGKRGCLVLVGLLVLAGVALGLNEFGIIAIPRVPHFLKRGAAAQAEPEAPTADEVAAEEPEPEPADTSASAAGEAADAASLSASRAPGRAAPTASDAERKAAEDKARSQARQREQRVADLVAELSGDAAVETLQGMTFEEQVQIFRMLEDKQASKLLEAMKADQRVRILQALKGPAGSSTDLLSADRLGTEEPSDSGTTNAKSTTEGGGAPAT